MPLALGMIRFNFLRDCPICALPCKTQLSLCETCDERLASVIHAQRGGTLQVRSLTIQYLIAWQPGDLFVKEFVHGLKGGRVSEVFEILAGYFLTYNSFYRSKNTLICYPSKGQKDHAYEWAQALSRITGFPTHELHLIDRTQKQSLLSLKGRKIRKFSNIPSLEEGQRVIFADDIVTTGSTAQGAFEALGRPKNFGVWSLFYRCRL